MRSPQVTKAYAVMAIAFFFNCDRSMLRLFQLRSRRDNDGVEMAIANKKSNPTSGCFFIHLNPNIHTCTG
jgi:hypothetical protein